MGITTKKPPLKETVGAQFICFNTMTEEGEWTEKFETEVEKTQVVKTIKVSENTSVAEVYASGIVYDADSTVTGSNIETEVIAFVAETLAKMRGDKVEDGGLILSGGSGEGRNRPYFAYGKVVKLKGGHFRWDWYPKCKLFENTDEAKTKEESFSEQTDTITIKAYPFNDAGDIKASVDSTMTTFPSGLTEEKFFAKPILTTGDLAAAVGTGV